MSPYWLAFAAALKLYSTYRQDRHSKDLQRQRTDAVRASRAQSARILEESLKKAKQGREPFTKESVAKTRKLKSRRLGEMLSQIPREEYAVTDPTLTNRPSIVARGSTAADARALQGIESYGRNLGDLTAETGAFNTTKQQLAGMESRYEISEKAREQRVIAALLANKLAGLQKTYSTESDLADKAGTLAAIYGGGIG